LNSITDLLSIIPSNLDNGEISWFLFWFIISYFILLFHTWKIKEIRDDVQGVEVLFISGVIGIILNWVSINVAQDIILKIFEMFKFIIKAITEIEFPQYEVSIQYFLSLFSSIFTEILIVLLIGMLLAMLFFLIWVIYELILLVVIKVIRLSIDPDDQFLKNYTRFKIFKEYQIGFFLKAFVPISLFFLFWLLFFVLIVIMPIPILNRIIAAGLSFVITIGLFSYLKKNISGPKKLFSKIVYTALSPSDLTFIDELFQEFFDLWAGFKQFIVRYSKKLMDYIRHRIRT
jgi:hypothetical protein